MVDVSSKEATHRRAVARCRVYMEPETTSKIAAGAISKGDVFAVARVAGIQAAKQTPNLLPLCHPLLVGSVFVNFRIEDSHVEVEAQVDTVDRTGVEMEAMTACAIAALTIYDMCKSIDRSMTDVPPPAPPRRRRIGHLRGSPGFADLACPKRAG